MRTLRTIVAAVALSGAALVGGSSVAGPPPGGPPIDPRAMSGIPRADPQLPAGTITIRVLDGGFDAPATDVEVTVEVTGADGKTETRTAKTDAQGRATVADLSAFIGGTAVAKATRGGEAMSSQPIQLFAEAGSRVMLVAAKAGATAGAGSTGAPKHGEAGGPEVPQPGTAFVLDGTPAGELVVGTFDLDARKPIGNVEVTLTITAPGGEVQTRKAISDARGKVAFDKLLPPDVAAGTQLEVSATLGAGQAPKTSTRFTMDAKVGMAVVLANGEFNAAPQAAAAGGRAQLPGPRVVPSLPNGTVRVRIVDGGDVPVPGLGFEIVKKDQTGNDVRFAGTTGPDGNGEVPVTVQSDAIYMVEARYDGGPYTSAMFQVDKRGGIAIDMRVFAVTDDVSKVRSVVQFDIDELENDLARVVQLQDVMVTGDEAYWPKDGLRIVPADGAKSVTVLPMSEEWLAHDEKAPYAKLAGPIPPGELTRLAMAYVIEHDGTVEIDFSTALDSLETSVMVGANQTLNAAGAKKSEHPSPIPDKTLWVMGPRAPGAKLEFAIGGLVTRNPLYRTIGLFGGLALLLATVAGVALRPRVDLRTRLVARRDELLAELDGIPAAQKDRRERVIAALDRVWRELDVLGEPRPSAPQPKVPVA